MTGMIALARQAKNRYFLAAGVSGIHSWTCRKPAKPSRKNPTPDVIPAKAGIHFSFLESAQYQHG
jgi:hypothetical protein